VTCAVSRPRDRRNDHAVLGIRDSRDARDHEDLGSSEVEGPPTAFATRVITGTAIVAVWASPPVNNSGSQMDRDVLLDEIDSRHADALGVDTQAPG
jgi:hypothetical protein